MKPYKSNGPNESGVIGYEDGRHYIRVWFTSNGSYLYTAERNGQEIIDEMISLALASRGLSTFISRNRRILDPIKE